MPNRAVTKRKSEAAETRLDRIATQLHEEVVEAERQYQSALGHAIRAGELLNEAHELVPHGSWGRWLAMHFDASPTVANTYMRLAKHRDEIAGAQTITAAVALIEPPRAEREATTSPADPDPMGAYRRASSALARALAYAGEFHPSGPVPDGYLPLPEFQDRAERLLDVVKKWEGDPISVPATQNRRADRPSRASSRRASGRQP